MHFTKVFEVSSLYFPEYFFNVHGLCPMQILDFPLQLIELYTWVYTCVRPV